MLKVLFAVVLSTVVVGSGHGEWGAVWKQTGNGSGLNFTDSSYWVDGHVGGLDAAEDVNFAAPFLESPKSGDSSVAGQAINIANAFTAHSVTGVAVQAFVSTGEASVNQTLVDPTPFRGIWARGGITCGYNINPADETPVTMRRFVNGHYNPIKVAANGTLRLQDVIGSGAIRLTGTGKTVIDTPRSLDVGVNLTAAGTLTVASPDRTESRIAPGAVFHFDAAAEETIVTFQQPGDSRLYVTNWYDADGGRARAYLSSGNWHPPFLSTETVNGHRLVDFGAFLKQDNTYLAGQEAAYGPAGFMYIGETNSNSTSWCNGKKYSEIFMVVKGHSDQYSGQFVSPLGYTSSSYQLPLLFTKGGMIDTSFCVLAYNWHGTGDYRAWLDGVPYLGFANNAAAADQVTTWTPTELHVIAFNCKPNSKPHICSLGSCRGFQDSEMGGFQMAEALAYENELTDDQRRETIDYLKRKWLSGMKAKDFDLGSVVIGNSSAKINVEADNTAKIRTLRAAQNVAGNATSLLKTGAGTLEVEEIVPRTKVLEVQGGAVMFSHDTPVASTLRANVPSTDMVCWLDGENSTYDGTDEAVTAWRDCREDKKTTVYAEAKVGSGDARPTRVTDATSGLPVYDFGGTVANTSPYMQIRVNGSAMSTAKEAFVVWKRKTTTGDPGFLNDGGRNGGLRSGYTTVFYDGWEMSFAKGALWMVNGRPIEPVNSGIGDFTNVGSGGFDVINYSSAKSMSHSYLALTGWSSNKNGGGCAIAEVIAYSRRLSDEERRNVTAYLMKKWKGVSYGLDEDDSIGTVKFTNGAQPKVGTKTDRTIARIEGEGTLEKSGAGELTVRDLDTRIAALDVREGTLKVKTDWMGDAWLHLDASVVDSFEFASGTGDGAEVYRWYDVRGNGLRASSCRDSTDSYVSGYSRRHPVYHTSGTSLGLAEGMPYVDFLDVASKSTAEAPVYGAGMFIWDDSTTRQTPTDVREIHMVYTFKSPGNVAVVGTYGGNVEDGLTASGQSYGGYFSTCTVANGSPKRSDGSSWFTGARFNPSGSDDYTARFHVTSMSFTGNVRAQTIGIDRNCGVGGIRLCELIMYRGSTNTAEKANAIHDYLCKKWKAIGEGASVCSSITNVNVAAGATAELSNLTGGAVAFASVTGCGTVRSAEGISGMTILNVTARNEEDVDCVTIDGSFVAPAEGVTVNFTVPADFKGANGPYPILRATSGIAGVNLADWTLNVIGSDRAFRLVKDGNAVFVQRRVTGTAIVVR